MGLFRSRKTRLVRSGDESRLNQRLERLKASARTASTTSDGVRAKQKRRKERERNLFANLRALRRRSLAGVSPAR